MRGIVSGIIVLVFLLFVLVGCSSKMSEEKYIEFVNSTLDESDSAYEQINLKLDDAFQGQFSSLKSLAENLSRTNAKAIKKVSVKYCPPVSSIRSMR